MPYRTEWVDAEMFLEHRGVRVYHTYKNDDFENTRRTCWYGLTPNCSDSGRDDGEFDVRKLSTWPQDGDPYSDGAIKQAIIAAIDKGELEAMHDEDNEEPAVTEATEQTPPAKMITSVTEDWRIGIDVMPKYRHDPFFGQKGKVIAVFPNGVGDMRDPNGVLAVRLDVCGVSIIRGADEWVTA